MLLFCKSIHIWQAGGSKQSCSKLGPDFSEFHAHRLPGLHIFNLKEFCRLEAKSVGDQIAGNLSYEGILVPDVAVIKPAGRLNAILSVDQLFDPSSR